MPQQGAGVAHRGGGRRPPVGSGARRRGRPRRGGAVLSAPASPARTPLLLALEGARRGTDLGVEVAADYGDPAGELDALRHAAAVVDRSARGLVAVRGPETVGFLQALLSADVAGLAPGEGARTLLLTPQGRLDVEARLLRLEGDGDGAGGDGGAHPGEPECWLDTEVGAGGRLAAGLLRFRLRTKVEVEDRTAGAGQIAVRGPDAARRVADALQVRVPAAPHAHVAYRGARVVRADRPGWPGVDVVGPLADVEAAWRALVGAGVARAGATAHEAGRVEAGVARLGPDLDEHVLAHEAFLDRDAVSFTKGCFLGQEVVCRIDSRGRVNRFLRRLLVDGPVPPPGAEVVVAGKAVGTVTSAVAPPGGGPVVALGFVRREVEPPAGADVRWDGGSAAATVLALPAGPPPR